MHLDGSTRTGVGASRTKTVIAFLWQALRIASRWGTVFFAVAVVAGAITAVVLATIWIFGWPPTLNEPLNDDRRLALGADTVAGATLLIALVGGLVAIAAYRVSIRAPRLELLFEWGEGRGKEVTVELDEQHGSPPFYPLGPGYRYATLFLSNRTRNTARNAAIRLRFHGFRGELAEREPAGAKRWHVVNHSQGGEALEWDGNGESSIHGTWQLVLPALDLRQLELLTSGAAIQWEIVAEQFAKSGKTLINCRFKSP